MLGVYCLLFKRGDGPVADARKAAKERRRVGELSGRRRLGTFLSVEAKKSRPRGRGGKFHVPERDTGSRVEVRYPVLFAARRHG